MSGTSVYYKLTCKFQRTITSHFLGQFLKMVKKPQLFLHAPILKVGLASGIKACLSMKL